MQDYGFSERLAVLINNAAVCLNDLDLSLRTNCLGPRQLIAAVLPMMKERKARILNISSGDGELVFFRSDLVEILVQPMTLEEWDRCVSQLRKINTAELENLVHGNQKAYRLSKALLNKLTRIVADQFGDENFLSVNALCPGDVLTDMVDRHATDAVSADKAAIDICWLCNLQESVPNGKFFRNRELIEW